MPAGVKDFLLPYTHRPKRQKIRDPLPHWHCPTPKTRETIIPINGSSLLNPPPPRSRDPLLSLTYFKRSEKTGYPSMLSLPPPLSAQTKNPLLPAPPPDIQRLPTVTDFSKEVRKHDTHQCCASHPTASPD